MPLVPMAQLLTEARAGGYAVCYCEAWNLESLQAVVEGAEEARLPVVAGFNGGFLAHPGRAKPENLAYYAAIGLALREAAVPVAFLLNETDDLRQIERGIDLGFNAVMVDGEHMEADEYRQLVSRVVRMAHARSVWVEAQVGRLAHGSDQSSHGAEATDPVVAERFVEETGADALSVSIGNVHVLTHGKASIDLEGLQKIHAKVRIPLVLHGGTGFPAELAREAIVLGVAKFNFGTVLKQVYLRTLAENLAAYREPMNPHPFAGMGGEQDALAAAREAVKLKVKELLEKYSRCRNIKKI